MKKSIFLSLFFVSFFSVAQSKYQKADKLFEDMYYLEASRLYKDAFDKGDQSQELLQKAGDSYYFNSKMEEASLWYEKLFQVYKDEEIESEYAFRFIHSLKGSNQLEKAKVLIGYFSESNILNPIQVAQLQKENQNVATDILARTPEFEVFNLNINTNGSDFGPMFYKDQIVFASSRDTMNARTREYHWNEQSFLNLYVADRSARKSSARGDSAKTKRRPGRVKLYNVEAFSERVNTRYHEASVSFSPDQQTMYFTRNNFSIDEGKKLERDTEGVNHLKLYRTEQVVENKGRKLDTLWTYIGELPFNSVEYSVGHPAVSPDGTTLYFVSDMPGGLGATDIYKVTINGDGTFGEPVNVGAPINTAGREMFPYVTENKFYFSSDGHIGLGALDVFETQLDKKGETYLEPRNLGAPLNSDLDDFAFIIDEESKEGYFSSNRKGGKGDDDIYAFVRTADVPLEVCAQSAKGIVTNILNGKPIPKAIVELYDSVGTLMEALRADEEGRFAFQAVLDCERTYYALASKEGYKVEEREAFMTTAELDLELELGLKIEPEIDLIVEENGVRKFKINNLYFDLDKHNIRPDAAAELEKIVRVMTEYPSIVLKIESHTDSRGSDLYNEALSDRRAKSTRDYLISRGIASERIESAIGYGEKRLLNECRNRVKCSNEKHDINRRSEFIITKM
ncbi:MAG: OmpA family protein [Bacteroidota bacterium]